MEPSKRIPILKVPTCNLTVPVPHRGNISRERYRRRRRGVEQSLSQLLGVITNYLFHRTPPSLLPCVLACLGCWHRHTHRATHTSHALFSFSFGGTVGVGRSLEVYNHYYYYLLMLRWRIAATTGRIRNLLNWFRLFKTKGQNRLSWVQNFCCQKWLLLPNGTEFLLKPKFCDFVKKNLNEKLTLTINKTFSALGSRPNRPTPPQVSYSVLAVILFYFCAAERHSLLHLVSRNGKWVNREKTVSSWKSETARFQVHLLDQIFGQKSADANFYFM